MKKLSNAIAIAILYFLTSSACLAEELASLQIDLATPSLTLTAGSGVSGTVSIRNNSAVVTASNIKATLPASWTDVTQDASGCATLSPGSSCNLVFTPGLTIYTTQLVSIQGNNTTSALLSMTVQAPSSAPISVSGSPLILTASGANGTLTVTNQSNVLSALNVSADLASAGLSGYMTQDASNCLSIAPLSSCTLVFTPGSSAVTATNVNISGSNTSTALANIAINSPALVPISITAGSPMELLVNGTAKSMTITNNSGTQTATGITSNFTSTALNGKVTQTGNTCASVNPLSSCTLTYTPGSSAVAATNFSIQGTNTSAINGNMSIVNFSTSAPVNTVVDAGQTASFSTISSGGSLPYSYQWQLDSGSGFANVSTGTGGTTANYTTAALLIGDNGNKYRVLVTDAASNTITSAAATLTVNSALSTTTPSDQSIFTGGHATFSTTTSGGTPAYSYQWQVSTDHGLTFTNVTGGSGANTNIYDTGTVDITYNGYYYRVVVSDSVSNQITSGNALLTVSSVLRKP